ncbi:hypothetical protein [Oceanobacillus senegalensis]|uniref:hypothetical protein n=1 Tax=Oceanobacillus senegalensis TaxID=1936063 RepID=UPI001FE7A8FB|nr:hypothetical protein [Oceanobacillus senegalensis]
MHGFGKNIPMNYGIPQRSAPGFGITPLTAGLIGAGLGFIGGELFDQHHHYPIYGPGFGGFYGPGFGGYGPGFYPGAGYGGYGPGYGHHGYPGGYGYPYYRNNGF